MATRIKKSRASAPVRFSVEEKIEEYDGHKQEENEANGDNMADMLSIVKEFQKRKSAKTSTGPAAFTQKKAGLLKEAREQADVLLRDGTTYIEQCKSTIDDLQRQDRKSDGILKDVVGLWTAHEKSVQDLLSIYPTLIEDLAPRRSKDVNSASETLETHPLAREASRRKVMKSARKSMEAGLENQQVATDASALVKHYKALLLS